jgi:3-isopropylmalate/(R)-2-methylmalate dehydratase small subunit
VWALDGYGFRALIAPSFAGIFYGNCLRNGLLPVVLKASEVNALFDSVRAAMNLSARIDLPMQRVTIPGGNTFLFEIDTADKERLLNNLDDIELCAMREM